MSKYIINHRYIKLYKIKLTALKIILLSSFILVFLGFAVAPLVLIQIYTSDKIKSKWLFAIFSSNKESPVISGIIGDYYYYLTSDKVSNSFFDLLSQQPKSLIITNPYLIFGSHKNNTLINASSNLALFNPASHILQMPNDIYISSNNNYGGTTKNLKLNTSNKNITSDQPIHLIIKNYRVDAQGIKVRDNASIFALIGPINIDTISANNNVEN